MAKELVENCYQINISSFRKDGAFHENTREVDLFSYESNGVTFQATNIKRNRNEVLYSYQRGNIDSPKSFHLKTFLTWTKCYYGGKRAWFLCPQKECQRRVGTLYLKGEEYLCRKCHNLGYLSQKKH